MKRIRKSIAAIISSIMLLSLAGCNMIEKTPEAIAKTVLAKVGDVKITRGDVDKQLASTLDYMKEQYGDDYEENEDVIETLKSYRQSTLESLVEQEVLKQKMKDFDIDYSDEDLEKDANEKIEEAKSNYDDEEEFLKELKNAGYKSEDAYKKYVKEQLKLSKVSEAIVKDVKVTDDEVKKYYEENQSSYVTKPGANITHIVFTDETTGESDAKAARELVLQGKTFDEVAAMDEYKDKSKSEDLGYVEYDSTSYDSDFMAGIQDLQEGQVSEPVKSSFGWHLIIATGIQKEEVTKTYDEVKDEIKSSLLSTKQQDKYKSKMKKYKKELKVKTYEDRL